MRRSQKTKGALQPFRINRVKFIPVYITTQMLRFWSWISDELYQLACLHRDCVTSGYISQLGIHLLYGHYLFPYICTAFLLKSSEMNVIEGHHHSSIISTCSIDSNNYPQQYITLNFCWPHRGLGWVRIITEHAEICSYHTLQPVLSV